MGAERDRAVDGISKTLQITLRCCEEILVDEVGNTLAELNTVRIITELHVDAPEAIG
jgi:hypothetical protein